MYPHGRAHWRHLANTIQPSVCGGDAVLCQIILTTLLLLLLLLIIMAALCSKCGHYIFVLWFLQSSFFFPCLFSAVADLMYTILPHMVWP